MKVILSSIILFSLALCVLSDDITCVSADSCVHPPYCQWTNSTSWNNCEALPNHYPDASNQSAVINTATSGSKMIVSQDVLVHYLTINATTGSEELDIVSPSTLTVNTATVVGQSTVSIAQGATLRFIYAQFIDSTLIISGGAIQSGHVNASMDLVKGSYLHLGSDADVNVTTNIDKESFLKFDPAATTFNVNLNKYLTVSSPSELRDVNTFKGDAGIIFAASPVFTAGTTNTFYSEVYFHDDLMIYGDFTAMKNFTAGTLAMDNGVVTLTSSSTPYFSHLTVGGNATLRYLVFHDVFNNESVLINNGNLEVDGYLALKDLTNNNQTVMQNMSVIEGSVVNKYRMIVNGSVYVSELHVSSNLDAMDSSRITLENLYWNSGAINESLHIDTHRMFIGTNGTIPHNLEFTYMSVNATYMSLSDNFVIPSGSVMNSYGAVFSSLAQKPNAPFTITNNGIVGGVLTLNGVPMFSNNMLGSSDYPLLYLEMANEAYVVLGNQSNTFIQINQEKASPFVVRAHSYLTVDGNVTVAINYGPNNGDKIELFSVETNGTRNGTYKHLSVFFAKDANPAGCVANITQTGTSVAVSFSGCTEHSDSSSSASKDHKKLYIIIGAVGAAIILLIIVIVVVVIFKRRQHAVTAEKQRLI